jgi:transcriptional antiterminator RfaH
MNTAISYSDLLWFVVQARAAGERLAETSLMQLGLETLLPLVRRKPTGWRARRNPVKALFPGYLFARFCADTQLRTVTYAHGVLRVVSAHEKPLPLDDPVIERLRARMDANRCVTLDPRPFIQGESVRITAGPLAGWEGIFDRTLSDAQRVVILLQSLHNSRLTLRADWVERCAIA